MFYEVIPIRLFREDAGILTYSSEQDLLPGQIVEVPIGKTKTFGIILKKVKSVDFTTKNILRLVYKTPLPTHVLRAIIWLSSYYLIPLPVVAKLFLPAGIGKKRRQRPSSSATNAVASTANTISPNIATSTAASTLAINPVSITPTVPLNSAQQIAEQSLKDIPTSTKLLHGVTGSGKTNIYLDLASEKFKQHQSTILLVPEIALTSQLVQIFKKSFGNQVVLIHSRQTEAERHLIWESINNSSAPLVIIGPRSALLSPVHNLGLIIIDEAHESTFNQDQNPKYSALRLASFIAQTLKISCIYGTATPLISDYYLANSKNSLVTLSKKAKKTAKAPDFKIINLKDPLQFTKNRYFSDELLETIAHNLKSHQQTLIFHNRRGSSPLTICEKCGWQALCPECYLPLTLHSDSFKLVCHTCGFHTKVPSSCPDCGHTSVIHKGFGTKLLESELKRLFKDARIARFDADNHKEETLDVKFNDVKNGDYDIIIGTQTIAKGLDLPHLATVGVVQADAGLSLPDFASEERTFHLLTQVIGRVGRGHLDATNVFIQTYQPEHPVIQAAIHSDYLSFYQHVLSIRKKGKFPPFYYLAKITVSYKTEALALKYINLLRRELTSKYSDKIIVSKPVPSFHEHTARGYNWQIIARSKSRTNLIKSLENCKKNSHFSFYLDPPSLL